MPIPAVQPHRGPVPSSRPAERDEYSDDYRDDDYRDARRADYPERPRRRGQIFSALVVLLTLAVSALLYVLTYQTLASVDILGGDPLGSLAGQMTMLVAAVFGAIVVIVLAVIALMIARPRALAALGLAASLLLPAGAVVLGVMYGGTVLQQNVQSAIAQAGPEVAAQGAAAAADAIVQELERRGVAPGPLRDLITRVMGQGG